MAASPSDALRRACAHRRLEMSTTVMQEVFGTTPCEQQKEVIAHLCLMVRTPGSGALPAPVLPVRAMWVESRLCRTSVPSRAQAFH
jgi:hypothetical protein